MDRRSDDSSPGDSNFPDHQDRLGLNSFFQLLVSQPGTVNGPGFGGKRNPNPMIVNLTMDQIMRAIERFNRLQAQRKQ